VKIVPRLGIVRIRPMKARVGRNPQTGEQIRIPARESLGYSVATELTESVLGKAR